MDTMKKTWTSANSIDQPPPDPLLLSQISKLSDNLLSITKFIWRSIKNVINNGLAFCILNQEKCGPENISDYRYQTVQLLMRLEFRWTESEAYDFNDEIMAMPHLIHEWKIKSPLLIGKIENKIKFKPEDKKWKIKKQKEEGGFCSDDMYHLIKIIETQYLCESINAIKYKRIYSSPHSSILWNIKYLYSLIKDNIIEQDDIYATPKKRHKSNFKTFNKRVASIV